MGPKKITRVIIDTNVVISGLLFGGTPGEVVTLWQSGKILPIASQQIIQEYLSVLAYPKFDLTEREISFLMYHEILPHFEIIKVIPRRVSIVQNDPSDDKFIFCALPAKAHTIISGDRNLLALGPYQGIEILSPSNFLAKYRS